MVDEIDLKDAYIPIPICESHRKYMRFRTGRRAFQFTYLPFGLSSAPWMFTKTMRPVAAKLRELGIRLVIYLDDILVISNSQEQAADHTSALIYTLELYCSPREIDDPTHPEGGVLGNDNRLEIDGTSRSSSIWQSPCKTQEDRNTQLVLITPLWPSQPWYPVVMDLLIDIPRLLPAVPDLILPVAEETSPKVTPRLVTWHISNNPTLHSAFQNQLHNSYWRHGEKSPPSRMTPTLKNWLAGARPGRGTDPISTSVGEVVNFLADLQNSLSHGLSHTIQSHLPP